MKELINEQIHYWLAAYAKQTNAPGFRKRVNRLNEQITTAFTIPSLLHLFNEFTNIPKNTEGKQFLYGPVHFYNGLRDWKVKLEKQQRTIEEAVAIIKALNATAKTAPIVTMLKAVFDEPVLHLHIQMANLVSIIRSKHLPEIMNCLDKVAVLPPTNTKVENSLVIEANRSWSADMLNALYRPAMANDSTAHLARNFLDSILCFYTTDIGFVEIELTEEKNTADGHSSSQPRREECVIC